MEVQAGASAYAEVRRLSRFQAGFGATLCGNRAAAEPPRNAPEVLVQEAPHASSGRSTSVPVLAVSHGPNPATLV